MAQCGTGSPRRQGARPARRLIMSLTAVHEDTEDSSLRQVWRLTHMLLRCKVKGAKAETRKSFVQPLKVHEKTET